MPSPLPLLSNNTVIEQPVDLSTLVARYTQFAGEFISRNAKAWFAKTRLHKTEYFASLRSVCLSVFLFVSQFSQLRSTLLLDG